MLNSIDVWRDALFNASRGFEGDYGIITVEIEHF
jgi:hypothetical protein